MGETLDKIKGAANVAGGRAKQAYGDATGDADAKAEGVGQELKGQGQKLKGAVKGAVNKL